MTGREQTAERLAKRMQWHDRPVGGSRGQRARMHEVRLDVIWPWDESVLALCARPDVVVCCRPLSEGGEFRGSEAERCDLLERAMATAPGYLDVELTTDPEVRDRLWNGRPPRTRLVLSAHRFEPLSACAVASLADRLAGEPADILKLAVPMQDAAEAAVLLGLRGADSRPAVRIGMGPGGLLTRLLPDAFGSPWTYVAASATDRTAPGQLDWMTAEHWRLGSTEPLVPIGLLGGRGVLRSPGPWAYNALFERHGWPYRYLPIVSERPTEAIALCEQLGFAGLSVTMPAKRAAIPLMHELGSDAARVGALNTLIWRGGRRLGLNTDLPAIAVLVGPGDGRRAVVLGAGGAARAAVVGAMGAGWQVAVSARDPAQARALAAEFDVGIVPWSARSEVPFDALINATPVGTCGCTNPLDLPEPGDDRRSWSGRTVLDMVTRAAPTPLLRAAAARGANAIDGLAMWRAQGAAQISAVTRHDITAAALLEAWDDGAGRAWSGSCMRTLHVDSPVPCRAPDSSPSRELPCGAARVSLVLAGREQPVRMRVPGSKSETQRALLCAALASGQSTLEQPLDCDDTRTLRASLEALGAHVCVQDARWIVDGGRLAVPAAPLWCHDGGTTARFLAPLSLWLDGPLSLDGSPRLRERPMAPLLDALRSLGVWVRALGEPERLPLVFERPPQHKCPPPEGRQDRGEDMAAHLRAERDAPSLATPRVRVDSSASSQFASGLLLVAPVLPGGLAVELEGAVVSRPYVALTVEIMRSFGARVRSQGDCIVVEPTGYRPTTRTIDGDWSGAAMLLAAGFVAERAIVLEGTSERSVQGDRAIVSMLIELARPGDHVFDLRDCPDLVAPLAAAAIVSGHHTILRGIAHARLKECDRPAVLARELGAVGARIALCDDTLVFEPGSVLGQGELDPQGDHRMAMAFGILSLREPGLRVRNPACVDKSWPGFWEQLERLR